MKTNRKTPKDIDDYIDQFPEEVRVILENVRRTIKESAPEAEETIKYQIPTFIYKGNLVHFAGYKNHIGFYPTPSGIEKFNKELSGYELAKGTIRFSLDQPIPYDLIRKIVQFRVDENIAKAETKTKKKIK